MREFVENIFLGNHIEAKELFEQRLEELVSDALELVKIRIADEIIGIDESGNIQRSGRTKLYRVRIRKGKVQRRVRKSDVPGFVYRGNKLIRMNPIERRHRKMAARLSKFKRHSKMQQTVRKRVRSIQRRKSMGITG